jgi:hypothetical protein
MRKKYAHEEFRKKCYQLEQIRPFVMANIWHNETPYGVHG